MTNALAESQLLMQKHFSVVSDRMELSEQLIVQSAIKTPQIRNIPQDLCLHDFRRCVLNIAVLNSIKTTPDQAMVTVLYNTLLQKYSWLTMDDIITAFKFNAQGELSQRYEHYQELSLNFFTQVLNEYSELKRKACNRLKALQPSKEPEVSKPEEAYNGLVSYREKNGQFPAFWSYGLVFQHMEEAGFFERTDPRKKTLHKKVLAEMKVKQEADLLSCRDLIERRNLEAGFDETVKAECRKRFVQMIIEKGMKGK